MIKAQVSDCEEEIIQKVSSEDELVHSINRLYGSADYFVEGTYSRALSSATHLYNYPSLEQYQEIEKELESLFSRLNEVHLR